MQLGHASEFMPLLCLLPTERVYSPFAKTFLAARCKDFATGLFRLYDRLKPRAFTGWANDFGPYFFLGLVFS
jgi:hypothetical protein